MYNLIAEGKLVVWELRRAEEILGTLTANGWIQNPDYIGGDFRPSQAFENYKHLFDEYNHVPIIRGETPSGLWVTSGWKRKNEIMEQIIALNLTLFPTNENALPGIVEEIIIPDDMEAQLRVDFEEPDETE
ncbi:MAG: hypothetical protein ABI690_07980 [Chloroflexota bacterium]